MVSAWQSTSCAAQTVHRSGAGVCKSDQYLCVCNIDSMTCIHVCTPSTSSQTYMYMYTYLKKGVRKKLNKAKQYSTLKAVTFLNRNELPRTHLKHVQYMYM